MAEGIIPGIIDIVSGINQRKRRARTQDALENYLTDPEGSIAAVSKIDAPMAINLKRQRTADDAAALKLKRDQTMGDLDIMSKFFRNRPEGADIGAMIDEATPFLRDTMGVGENGILNLKTALAANPGLIEGLDDKTFEALTKDRYSSTVATPGAHVLRGGKVIDKVPFASKTVTTRGGGGASRTDIFDPNAGRFITDDAGAPAPTPMSTGKLTVDDLLPHVVAQESSDNYKAVNAETGALGRYQVMPATGKNLARQLGLAWRPDMMKRDDAASRRYQDAIGRAAIQESVDFAGGDPSRVFSHYYGGPDESKWGPRTRKYTEEMLGRIGAAGGGEAALTGSASPTSISMPGKPTDKSYRPATKEEIAAAGYPEGTAAQVDQDGKLVNLKTPTAGAQKANADKASKAIQLTDHMTTMANDVARLSKHPGLKQATGYLRGLVPAPLLGQEATDFINQLEALKSNIGLNKLLEFKAGSSQGASGFGNLSNAEGERLERAFGDLKRTNSDTEIQRIFAQILDTSAKVLKRQADGLTQYGAGAAGGGRPTAVDPKTGQRLMLSADGSKWEKVN